MQLIIMPSGRSGKMKNILSRTLSERIAESLFNSNDRDFWAEIKRIRSKSVGMSRTVDGISDGARISKLFADK